MRPVRPTHGRQPFPDVQEHHVPLAQLVPELLLERREAFAILIPRALQLRDPRVVLRDGARRLMVGLQRLLERLLVGPARVALPLEQLGQLARLQPVAFQQRIAVAQNRLLVVQLGPSALELQRRRLQFLLQFHDVGDQTGPTAREIAQRLPQVVLEVHQAFLPGGGFDLLRRQVLLELAGFLLGGRCLAVQFIDDPLHLLLLFAADDLALVPFLGQPFFEIARLVPLTLQAHPVGLEFRLQISNLDLVAVLLLTQERDLVLARLDLDGQPLNLGVSFVEALLQRLHLPVAVLQFLLDSLVPLEVVLRIFFEPDNALAGGPHFGLQGPEIFVLHSQFLAQPLALLHLLVELVSEGVQLLLSLRPQVLESFVALIGHLQGLVAFLLEILHLLFRLIDIGLIRLVQRFVVADGVIHLLADRLVLQLEGRDLVTQLAHPGLQVFPLCIATRGVARPIAGARRGPAMRSGR
ncbi:hypothetical protein ASPCADRAFT_162024 [Aspergillus carbonarius ITEM 5010]|uniref:Uncharacterized protein n=1 Tax=Aspergillus carbonarius (strain ITEM 5010) TaxID=602072 RepID=A0A1R3RVJ7_ASPC5|nr:hypothetical protein ASPCADRAFT_162024 [Aspergillus carbonarius ITEM 5010]